MVDSQDNSSIDKSRLDICYKIIEYSYDFMIQVHLLSDTYTQIKVTPQFRIEFPTFDRFSDLRKYFCEHLVVKEDIPSLKNELSKEALQKEKVSSIKFRAKNQPLKVAWNCLSIFTFPKQNIAILGFRIIEEESVYIYPNYHYDAALRNIYDELYELDITNNHYRIIYHTEGKYVIPAMEGNLEEGIQIVSEQMIHPEDKSRFLKLLSLESLKETFLSGRDNVIGEFRKLWIDKKYHWASLTILPLDSSKDKEVYLCFVMDIDAKKHADEIILQNRILRQKQSEDERYRIVVEQTKTMVMEWNGDTHRFYASPKIKQFYFGSHMVSKEQIFCQWPIDKGVYPEDIALMNQFVLQIKQKQNPSVVSLRLLKQDGNYVWCKLTMSFLYNQKGMASRSILTINNIDEMKKTEIALKYRAEYDMLTGIYNLDAFELHTQQLLLENPNKKYAIVRLDINRFKFINDLYGVEEGNKLLQFIAALLTKYVGILGLFGRFNSDIFCFCIEYHTEQKIIDICEKINQSLAEYSLGYKIVPSFGVCVVDNPNIPVNILCDWANLALKTVKGNMIKNCAFYDDTLRKKQLEERYIENEMEKALLEHQFVVYLQPKHEISTSRVVGAEALVRWEHPSRGLVQPGSFIPLFERNGFIVHLDEYVWEETFKMIRRWIESGYAAVPVSVNVSRIHAYTPEFYQKLEHLVEKYQIPSNLIELELTESTFIENTDELYQTMQRIEKLGIQFSMDDFGSGYSSLNMLKNAPINTIKLDREFLNETAATKKGQIIIQNVIAMANQLNLAVVAEGAETEKQAEFLLQAGCSVAQGYYFSRPMPITQFEKLAFYE